ncbi:MAG TPA: DUF3307 domain-containing protein [Solirubrobacteraceae bacterium]|nr:DUF3307 domain-containing protein [Solirubrobacteraceae bacterium]
MSWPGAMLALLVSHIVGDVLLQTDWQAVTKTGGLGDASARRALLRHVAIYTVAFIPALVWIGDETTAARAVAVGALVAVPHLVIDDGRLVRTWLRVVKHAPQPVLALTIAVDQSFHVLCLFGAALVAAG